MGWQRPRSITISPKDQWARSYSLARLTVSIDASNRAGQDLASSHSRAASLTGAPIVVYSKRCLAPTFSGDDLSRRHPDASLALRHFAIQSTSDSASGSKRLVLGTLQAIWNAKHGQRRVPLEFVDKSVMAVHFIDDHLEKPVEQLDNICRRSAGHQLCRAHDIDENDCDVSLFTAQLRWLPFRSRCDLAPDVAAEEIAHMFPFT